MGQFAIIQQDEGEWGLIVKETLDRETKDRYTLKVTATDGKFETPVTVDVHVLDINDNSPLCEQVKEVTSGALCFHLQIDNRIITPIKKNQLVG